MFAMFCELELDVWFAGQLPVFYGHPMCDKNIKICMIYVNYYFSLKYVTKDMNLIK